MRDRASPLAPPGFGYVFAVVGTAAAVGVAALFERAFGLQDLSLVFMLAVVLVAAHTRTGPALATAVLCFLAYNFFFIAPRYSLFIEARHGVATVALFLAAALIAGRMASTLAMQVHALREAHRHAELRQALAQRLRVARSEYDVVRAATAAYRDAFDAETWVRLHAHDAPAPGSADQHGWWFLPLRGAEDVLGTVGLKRPGGDVAIEAGQRVLAQTLAADLAQALQRVRLDAALQAERTAAERERLRNALLSSVSHDLRTPLAAIIGAAESLERYADAMPAEDRASLLALVREEGGRMDRYVRNLLDMTRLDGEVSLQRDWIGVDELIGAAVARVRRVFPGRVIGIRVSPELPPLHVQPALLEQALFNVIENAVRVSPVDAAVDVAADADAGAVRIAVRDRGPGIPEAERERVFERFYSVARGDARRGTGLGLAIARGVLRAHGGGIAVGEGDDGVGTVFTMQLPAATVPVEATP